MKTVGCHANTPVASVADESSDSGSSDNHPMHDIAHVPNFPKQSLCSGHTHSEPGGDMCDVAFLARLPSGVELSQMPDPHSVHEAMAASNATGWVDTMDCKMDNLCTRDVYELVLCTSGMRTIRLGWVPHRKFKNSTFDKNKVCLVACGNHQRPGIDHGESFMPVMHLESLCTLLALAASNDLDIMQFDITSAYLHGTLKEELYVEQPDSCVAPGKETWVWCLKKGLYGLIQVGHTWNEELNGHMESVGYAATGSWDHENFVAGGFWVDNFIGIGSGEGLNSLAKSVDEKYGITGLGEVKWVLGMLIERDRDTRLIYILQEAFIKLGFTPPMPQPTYSPNLCYWTVLSLGCVRFLGVFLSSLIFFMACACQRRYR